jgi:hypothetical protein
MWRVIKGSGLWFWERGVIARALVLPIRAASGQKEVVVASCCGAMAAGVSSGTARLGEGSGLPHIMDVASICASMLARARCFARWWEKHRRGRARGWQGCPTRPACQSLGDRGSGGVASES